jgi:hypothetical protein
MISKRLAILSIAFLPLAFAQDDPEKFTVNSPVVELRQNTLGTLINATGVLHSTDAANLNAALCTATNNYLVSKGTPVSQQLTDCNRTTFYHIVKFEDADHEKIRSQQWYVHDTRQIQFGEFYTQSSQAQFEAAYVRGERNFQFIYVHLLSTPGEPFRNAMGTLLHPVGYSITVTRRRPQFLTDAIALAGLVGLPVPGAAAAAVADPVVGYFTVFQFESQFSRSDVTIAAKIGDEKKTPPDGGKGVQTQANDSVKKAYVNEGPQWAGLSIAVPLTTYKDVEYNQTDNTLQAKTVKRENIYAVLNVYLPPVDVGQTRFRYLPHPLFGVPIKGQPLRHLMAGLAIGLNWVEPFAGVVFNRQQRPIAPGSTTLEDHLVRKLVFGVNIPIGAAKAALAKK